MNSNTWKRARLADVVVRWTRGSTPRRSIPAYYTPSDGTPWVKVEDIHGGVLTYAAEQLSEQGSIGMQLVERDAVLVTSSGTIGKTAIAGTPVYCNQAVQALEFDRNKILPKYAYYYLRFSEPILAELSTGTTIPNLTNQSLKNFTIAYPGLKEQECIVRRLKTAETFYETATRFEKLLGELSQTYVTLAAAETADYRPLTSVLTELPRIGWQGSEGDDGTEMRVVTGLRRREGGPAEPEVEIRYSPSAELSRLLRKNDILLRRASAEHRLVAGIVGEKEEGALFSANLVRLRPGPEIGSEFLCAWLQGQIRDALFGKVQINLSTLKQFYVPVPNHAPWLEHVCAGFRLLAEKADRMSRLGVELLDALSYRDMFVPAKTSLLAEDSISLYEIVDDIPWVDETDEAWPRELNEQMVKFLEQMSEFQKELYRVMLKNGAMPVHLLFKNMDAKKAAGACIQDALTTVSLLEQFGLAEQEGERTIPIRGVNEKAGEELPFPMSFPLSAKDQEILRDHNGQPIYVETYKPTGDIFKENGNGIGAGDDS